MATFELDGGELRLVFSGLEVLGGLRSGAKVPVSDVASVEVSADPWDVVSGVRVGTAVPWVVLLGTMLRSGPNDVVAIYRRKPAVVVTLREGASYQRLIATVEDPEKTVGEIKAAMGS